MKHDTKEEKLTAAADIRTCSDGLEGNVAPVSLRSSSYEGPTTDLPAESVENVASAVNSSQIQRSQPGDDSAKDGMASLEE